MDRMSDYVDGLTRMILVFVLAIMAVVVFAQVLFRYVLNLPLFWTEEFARYALVWASLLGAGVAFKRGEHIAVTFFTERFLPGKKAVDVDYLVDVSVLTFLAIMFVGGISLVDMTRSQISPALRISMAIPYLAIPIGAAIMLVHQTAATYKKLRLCGIIKTRLRLKLVTITPPDHPYHAGAEAFARLVRERAGGKLAIAVTPVSLNETGEEGIARGLQMGSIDLAIISTGSLATFSPEIGVLDLPYVLRDQTHVDAVIDGEIGDRLLHSFDQVKGLAFFENGFRHFTSASKILAKPEDFAGLKIRTMDNQVHMASIRSLGAEPVPMKWGAKLLQALSDGDIDGQENPITIIDVNHLETSQKHLALTGHFYSAAPLCINRKLFETLRPAWQEMIRQAAAEAAVIQRKAARDGEQARLDALQARGMEVRTVERPDFYETLQPVSAFFLDKHPSWKELAGMIEAAAPDGRTMQ